jgi:hypothetical protein
MTAIVTLGVVAGSTVGAVICWWHNRRGTQPTWHHYPPNLPQVRTFYPAHLFDVEAEG